MASKIEKTEGVVLRFYDYGDTSRIVVLLTRDFGKLKIMAKGVKGKKSPLAGRLELFNVVDLQFYFNSRGDLHTLKEANIKKIFPSFHEKLIAFASASYLSELVQIAIHGESNEVGVYDFFIQTLNVLGDFEGNQLPVHWFEVKVLHELGVLPQVDRCVQCSEKLKDPFRLSPLHSGFVCSNCIPQGVRFIPISSMVPGVISFFAQVSLDRAVRVKLTGTQRIELKKVLRNFLDFNLERRLKSSEFLDKLLSNSESLILR